jgi:GT2 family glycosyltransferase
MREHEIAPGVRGWLESPAHDVIASDCLSVCGWAFASGARIVDVWSTGFGARRPLQCGIQRDDVARLYTSEPNSRHSGFTGYLELEGAVGERVNFDIWARLDDGRTIRLFQRALITRAAGYDRARLRTAVRDVVRRPGVLFSARTWKGALALLRQTRRAQTARPPASATGKAALRRTSRAALAEFLRSRSELTFPPAPSPDVSIVLVVWNHADLSLMCLGALAGENDVPTELIVVDNASTDETSELLSRVKGARVITNGGNLGFTVALNIGARAATGEFVLFVNNDAAVIPGTIRQMRDTARRSTSIGAVGGKLVYPDGRLQEAGSIIWSDGSCESFGRGGDPDAPEYNFERPVDFCSAALLLTRRSVFDALGGFDERYRPAYYDDADYCVRVWTSGHSVVFQPKGAAIHYEFGSTSPEASMELQLARRPLFVATHRSWLASQLSSQDWQWRRAHVHPHDRPSVIVIDDAVPDPRAGAGFPRAAVLLKTLADLGYLITLYATNQSQQDASSSASPGTEVVAGGPDGLRSFLSSRKHHDLLLVSRPHNMQYVKAAIGSDLSALGVPCIYDAEAIYAIREIRRRDLLGPRMAESDAAALIDAELGLARGCAAVLAVSEVERSRFESFGVAPVIVAGHAVDPQPTPNPYQHRRSILFVGAFSPQSPNEDAVTFLCREVVPRLRRAGCAAPIVVAGANLPAHLRELDATVSWHADVEDLTALYNDARLFVVPTRFSAGISLKVIEAAARGIPVVCAPSVAEPLGWKSGREVLTGTSPDDYAAAIVSLYSQADLWQRLREAALARVSTDFSPARFHAAIQDALASLPSLATT